MGNVTAKGYQFLQFADAFERYLAEGDTSVTASQVSADAASL